MGGYRRITSVGSTPDVAALGAPSPTAAADDLATLFGRMAGGDQAALSAIYERTVAQAFAVAMGVLRSREDAEEIVCDVYSYVWSRAGTFDPGRGSVRAWLAVITRNRAIDRLRRRRAHLSLDDERQQGLADSLTASVAGPEDILSRFQSGSAVQRALQTLTPQRQRVLGLAFFQGLSHQEIADALGVPLGTVKSHVRRALAALQCELLSVN